MFVSNSGKTYFIMFSKKTITAILGGGQKEAIV
jgi:hypothetical protein